MAVRVGLGIQVLAVGDNNHLKTVTMKGKDAVTGKETELRGNGTKSNTTPSAHTAHVHSHHSNLN